MTNEILEKIAQAAEKASRGVEVIGYEDDGYPRFVEERKWVQVVDADLFISKLRALKESEWNPELTPNSCPTDGSCEACE